MDAPNRFIFALWLLVGVIYLIGLVYVFGVVWGWLVLAFGKVGAVVFLILFFVVAFIPIRMIVRRR